MIIYKDLNFKYFNTLHINNIINYFFEIENHDEIYILKYLFDYFNLQYYTSKHVKQAIYRHIWLLVFSSENRKYVWNNGNRRHNICKINKRR